MSQTVLKDFTQGGLAVMPNGRWAQRYPQWREPGANARPVLRRGLYQLTGAAGTNDIATYTVPEGFRFVFTGLVFEFLGSGWVEGSAELSLDIVVVGPAGVRPVQYLQSIRTSLGSRTQGPYPIPALIQLNNSNQLIARLTDGGSIGPGNSVLVHLDGFEFPESEAAF